MLSLHRQQWIPEFLRIPFVRVQRHVSDEVLSENLHVFPSMPTTLDFLEQRKVELKINSFQGKTTFYQYQRINPKKEIL